MDENSCNNRKNSTLYLVMSLQFFYNILHQAKILNYSKTFERTDFFYYYFDYENSFLNI